jgi:hypothetical protein
MGRCYFQGWTGALLSVLAAIFLVGAVQHADLFDAVAFVVIIAFVYFATRDIQKFLWRRLCR